jgi:CBS domain containing-hemolysin-like protein
VGNNIANYVVSLAIVLGTQVLFGDASPWPGLIASIVLSPLLFVYGESLPKQIFHDAPNRLLRKCGWPLVACLWLFSPVTILLGAINKILQKLVGESLEEVRLTLARKELQQVFEEGHEAGILRPAQQGLAQGLFALAHRPASSVAMSATRMPQVISGTPNKVILQMARRWRIAAFAVEANDGSHKLLGYVRVADVYLHGEQTPPLRPLIEIRADETYISALNCLYDAGESLGHVVGPAGETVGFVTIRHLSEPLFRGQ